MFITFFLLPSNFWVSPVLFFRPIISCIFIKDGFNFNKKRIFLSGDMCYLFLKIKNKSDSWIPIHMLNFIPLLCQNSSAKHFLTPFLVCTVGGDECINPLTISFSRRFLSLFLKLCIINWLSLQLSWSLLLETWMDLTSAHHDKGFSFSIFGYLLNESSFLLHLPHTYLSFIVTSYRLISTGLSFKNVETS